MLPASLYINEDKPGLTQDPNWKSRIRILVPGSSKLCYVRVVGRLHEYYNNRTLAVTGIHKVEAFNEVLHHALAAAVATTWARNGGPVSSNMRRPTLL